MIKLEEGMTKQLTDQEILEVLNKINFDSDYIANGSSRISFYYEDGIIAKVAATPEGLVQNDNEVNFYLESDDTSYLAHIYAYGGPVILMQEVVEFEGDSFDWEEFDDVFTEEDQDRIEQEIEEIVDEINCQIGSSSDSYQMGFVDDYSRIVIYDYGYNTVQYESHEMIGKLCDIFQNEVKELFECVRDCYQQFVDGELNIDYAIESYIAGELKYLIVGFMEYDSYLEYGEDNSDN